MKFSFKGVGIEVSIRSMEDGQWFVAKGRLGIKINNIEVDGGARCSVFVADKKEPVIIDYTDADFGCPVDVFIVAKPTQGK